MSRCQAVLYIGDDHGDNHATMRCQLEDGHLGPHEEAFRNETVRCTWLHDEREEDDGAGPNE